jgi:hypothetical protein
MAFASKHARPIPTCKQTSERNDLNIKYKKTLGLLVDADTPTKFWEEAYNTACYLHKIISPKMLGYKSSFQVAKNRKCARLSATICFIFKFLYTWIPETTDGFILSLFYLCI